MSDENYTLLLRQISTIIRMSLGKKGWSQAYLAKRAGISRQYLNRIINQSADPTLNTVADIFWALGEDIHFTGDKQ